MLLERAAQDYSEGFRTLTEHADYVGVNVSSPNTPKLHCLQEVGQTPACREPFQYEDGIREFVSPTGQSPMDGWRQLSFLNSRMGIELP